MQNKISVAVVMQAIVMVTTGVVIVGKVRVIVWKVQNVGARVETKPNHNY